MPESVSREPLVWVDCEMTGLDTSKDTIMQIACFITDWDLNLLEPEGIDIIIHHDKSALDAMGPWCRDHHARTGLTQRCLESSTSAEQASQDLLSYIKRHVPERRKALLAGNTVHMDKEFLRKEPYTEVLRWLHHRILDVSAIKEAAKRWAEVGVLKGVPRKEGRHEARQDILESIEECRYYRRVFFSQGTGEGKDVGEKAEGK